MKKLWSLLALLLLTGLVAACSGGKPEDVAVSFVQASYKGDADKMISMIYIPEDDKKEAGVEELVSGKLKGAAAHAKEEAERKGGVKTVNVEKSDIDEANGTGKVTLKVEFKNDGSQGKTEFVKLIKNDGKWKVNL